MPRLSITSLHLSILVEVHAAFSLAHQQKLTVRLSSQVSQRNTSQKKPSFSRIVPDATIAISAAIAKRKRDKKKQRKSKGIYIIAFLRTLPPTHFPSKKKFPDNLMAGQKEEKEKAPLSKSLQLSFRHFFFFFLFFKKESRSEKLDKRINSLFLHTLGKQKNFLDNLMA